MDNTLAALIYLLLSRLAIAAVGGLSIFLGYRLFALGFAAADKGATAEAKLGKDVSLSLKNAAPGTVFALFGAAMIVVLLTSAPPTFVETKPDGSGVSMRAGEAYGLETDDRTAIADALHRQALAFHGQKPDYALRLMGYATRFDAGDANLWDTLASFQAAKGDFPAAATAMEKAATQSPGNACYQQRLAAFRDGKTATECGVQ